ncbi:MAG TPA: ATP-binding protein [Chitinophagaceae bacterium]|jgi:signal transduction histidine kinase|nr:ATP-binding protein [Chitinophagaceae bacterium]
MHTSGEEVILILIISTVLILLLGTVVVIALLIQNKRKYKHRQQLSEMQAHYERTLLQTELKILEETFSAISQNLHDNVGSNISTAMLLLYKDENMNASEQEINRKEALAILDKIVDDLKNIARSLNPDYLHRIGLNEAIQQRIEQLAKTKKYELELSLDGNPQQLDKKKQVILFYIFQEAVNNISTHAQAKKISVKLQYEKDNLFLQIADDGLGMEMLSDSIKGAGLINMKNHAEMIGGTLEIISDIGRGTELKIIVPNPYYQV